MSVILYKDGVAHRINPYRVPQHLNAGYTTSPEEENSEGSDGGEDLSLSELRELAREEGIEGWDTKKSKTLRKELGIE